MHPLVDSLRWWVSRHPLVILAGWIVAAALIVYFAPNLTQLAAAGQARLLPKDSESGRAAAIVRQGWPGQWFGSLAVLGFHRPAGLTESDLAYCQRVVEALRAKDKPPGILRVVGTDSPPEIVERLVSEDGTLLLTLITFDNSFVSPSTHEAVKWVEATNVRLTPDRPEGLKAIWTGDAVLGRDYMRNVQISLDRAAYVTVFLLLVVLLVVYRSPWLALVPLITIVVGMAVARGLLGWMTSWGWEVSPLVELFLVVILFGCGTDYGLFLSWRFGEHWNPTNPAGALRTTLGRALAPLVASAGTTIVGLSLMGITRFKLFSSTGPSVAIGLVVVLLASVTLTPALLLILARLRPSAFRGVSKVSSGWWESLARWALARPWLAWAGCVVLMFPAAVLGMKLTLDNNFVQDTISEMNSNTASVKDLRLMSDKFGDGVIAPLTVLIRSQHDLRESEGLALIDDVSRLLSRQASLAEVRSATQPLGSTEPLERARLAARLAAVEEGFGRMSDGARRLEDGLTQGAARLRMAVLLDDLTGGSLLGGGGSKSTSGTAGSEAPDPAAKPESMTSGLLEATAGLLGGRMPSIPVPNAANPTQPLNGNGPREQLLREITTASQGAGQIHDGAERAREEIRNILSDPVGRHALDRLLINRATIDQHPDLQRAFSAYIAEDGHTARIDVLQADRAMSPEALNEIDRLRSRLREFFGTATIEGERSAFLFGGGNAAAADIRAITRRDQAKSWVIVPLGVFLVLLAGLRSPLTCLNLVGTMFLTYAFSLGVTHAVFVWGQGCEGLDWKVPYFLFVLLIAVGVDYNVFLMARLDEETRSVGLRSGIIRAVAQTGSLISSAAAITVCSFAALMFSPLVSLQQLGFALVLGIATDAILVRPLLVPCGHWLMNRHHEPKARKRGFAPSVQPEVMRVVDS